MKSNVEVYIYDLAMGMASNFSGLVGFQLDGIWHTAIICYGHEWFYGNGGIEQCTPGGTMLGQPLKKVDLGQTQVDFETFLEKLEELQKDKFRPDRYNLLDNNCNNFSDVMARFLTGKGIPSYILDLPQRVKQSPIASLLAPMIENATPRGEDIHQEFSKEHEKYDSPEGHTSSHSARKTYKHFPQTEYLKFDQMVEADKFIGKFRQILARNINQVGEGNWDMSVATEIISAIIMPNANLTDKTWRLIAAMMKGFPDEDVFPVLDVARWITSKNELKEEPARLLISQLMHFLLPSASSTNMQLALKVLCNLFQFSKTRNLLVKEREAIVSKLNTILEEVEVMSNIVQIALASLLLNYSVYVSSYYEQEAAFQIVSSLCTLSLSTLKSSEALYRSTIALGTLTCNDKEARDLALALDARPALGKLNPSDSEKLRECIQECKTVLIDS